MGAVVKLKWVNAELGSGLLPDFMADGPGEYMGPEDGDGRLLAHDVLEHRLTNYNPWSFVDEWAAFGAVLFTRVLTGAVDLAPLPDRWVARTMPNLTDDFMNLLIYQYRHRVRLPDRNQVTLPRLEHHRDLVLRARECLSHRHTTGKALEECCHSEDGLNTREALDFLKDEARKAYKWVCYGFIRACRRFQYDEWKAYGMFTLIQQAVQEFRNTYEWEMLKNECTEDALLVYDRYEARICLPKFDY